MIAFQDVEYLYHWPEYYHVNTVFFDMEVKWFISGNYARVWVSYI